MKKCVVLLLLFTLQASAWWETPHMLVAQIAYDNLQPEVRKKADELIAIHAGQYPKSNDFVTASMWADDIRARGDSTYSSWHYVNLRFKNSTDPIPNFPKQNHVSWAINQEIIVLQNPSTSDKDKALALRRLIHWVGDIHQPLHASTHISPHYPQGDTGGNLFLLGLDKPFTNLHAYWDSGLNLWSGTKRPLTAQGRARLVTESQRLQALHGQTSLGNMDPYAWATDSHRLARQYAYTGIVYKGIPSPDYIAQGQLISEKQVTLAGQRLAVLLNKNL